MSAGGVTGGGRDRSLAAGNGVCNIRSGRSSMVERRGVTLVCGAVPSMVESETPSAVPWLKGHLAGLYSFGAVGLQGTLPTIFGSNALILCVIIFSRFCCQF